MRKQLKLTPAYGIPGRGRFFPIRHSVDVWGIPGKGLFWTRPFQKKHIISMLFEWKGRGATRNQGAPSVYANTVTYSNEFVDLCINSGWTWKPPENHRPVAYWVGPSLSEKHSTYIFYEKKVFTEKSTLPGMPHTGVRVGIPQTRVRMGYQQLSKTDFTKRLTIGFWLVPNDATHL